MLINEPKSKGLKEPEFIEGVTLQINISAGDLNYLELTLPRLINQHRTACREILLIVDCCRPQATHLVDPDKRFPARVFHERIVLLKELVSRLGTELDVDRCVFLESPRDDSYFRYLANKWMGRGVIPQGVTHSGGGTAFMAYWAALDLPRTRHVLHFDADMIIQQPDGADWVTDAVDRMEKDERFISAIPRNAPPLLGDTGDLYPQKEMGRALENICNEWTNDWFSTRLFLSNRQRLAAYLPLLSLWPLGCLKFYLEMWLRRFSRRTFPCDPEIILFKRMSTIGMRSLILHRKDVWSLHPVEKNLLFLNILPKILKRIDVDDIPEQQRGLEDIILEVWERMPIAEVASN